ncbi:hypothetical protein BO94DRAFT_580020 [Aspergillus sclerotioniger CBS 115572]|uniref:Uncharacterized protein n=1 Tax=Aspergillus sclerotioniger CBS 115572 TaxID=1450535 RepID=A0A317XGQ6_9EURO|nr:hypothetical protein BO94DRAFT_580020 [Aspergillus sclerotioniger CBS 115572]PWY96150.1 hypothetical protein BO94DRAFT_580020 [Aspergillus sclerotioniger CBS 115572]
MEMPRPPDEAGFDKIGCGRTTGADEPAGEADQDDRGPVGHQCLASHWWAAVSALSRAELIQTIIAIVIQSKALEDRPALVLSVRPTVGTEHAPLEWSLASRWCFVLISREYRSRSVFILLKEYNASPVKNLPRQLDRAASPASLHPTDCQYRQT